MHFKLIIAVVDDADTDRIVESARTAGATGATVISQARGEGIESGRSFFRLDLGAQRDVVLLLVERHLARRILETIGTVGRFDNSPGTGIAFQLDVEDAIGVLRQEGLLHERVEEEI